MSLQSAGFTAKLLVVTENGTTEVGYVSTDKCGEEEKKKLYKELFSQFIDTEHFSELTYQLGGDFSVKVEYFVHTHI